jgi:ribonucleoside-triphosphate reductase
MAGEVSKDLTMRLLLPPDIVEAHEEGLIHFHDSDYFAQHMHNCELVNLKDMLDNGTVINGTKIDTPKSFMTACTVATQIVAQIASVQYGGQTISISHLAPYVRVSYEKIKKKVIREWSKLNVEYTDEQLEAATMDRLHDEIKAGVQTIQYQINTLMTTNGQAPFLSIFMYLSENPEYIKETAMIIEEILNQRILGTKNKVGVYVSPSFPKLLYVLEENNIHEDSPYYYLTELSAKCSAKRLVPDYISEKKMKELKDGYCFPCMGCRSFLPPWHDENGNAKFYGRFNQGVVTINLVDVALSSGGDEDKFWSIMEDRLDLCYRALMCRHNRLKGTLSDVAPIQWQHGAIARLKEHEVIDPLLFGSYSSISLGYGGLYECTKYMTGASHTGAGKEFALKVMKCLNDHCNTWKAETNIGFSVYGTPMESTTYKFARCLKKRFGVIPGVTDKDYITNSYHVHVTEPIDAFKKLSFEAEFQAQSLGGCISYIEVPDMQNNIEAVLTVIKFIYDNIMYAEINSKSDYCQVCGFDGEMQIDDDMNWYCPNCGNRDQMKMNVTRRTCGYLGHNFWNKGRTQEIKERVLHL